MKSKVNVDRAKSIQNRPRINEDPKDALLREYQEEIKQLRALISGQLGTTDLSSECLPCHWGPMLKGCDGIRIQHVVWVFTISMSHLALLSVSEYKAVFVWDLNWWKSEVI